MKPAPFVRLVVVNYDGGEMTLACLDSLAALEWPDGRRETVLVDNASSDGVADAVSDRPGIRVIRSPANVGFGAGCNAAMTDLDGVDYVALVNNDAVVSPGWLAPLVAALEEDPRTGAANGKVLFASVYTDVAVESDTFVPGRGDRRRLGVRVSGARVDGVDVSGQIMYRSGVWGREQGEGEEATFRWTDGRGELLLPAPERGLRPPACQLRLATAGRRRATIVTAGGRVEHEVGDRPTWFDVAPTEDWFDVVNSAGAVILAGGFGPERGFLERDEGQYDNPAEVFAWTGSAVLLAARYLADVGLFDPRLFLYYEDFDLSWRGRIRGWRYLYVPEAVARHLHSATVGTAPPDSILHYLERNRLVVLTRNGPWPMVVSALSASVRLTVESAAREAWNSMRIGRGPATNTLRQRTRFIADYLRLLPATLADRRRLNRGRRVRDSELLRWVQAAAGAPVTGPAGDP